MPTYNPLNLLGDYRLANRREAEGVTPPFQANKERQKAWGVPFLNFVGKAGELPYLVGTAGFSEIDFGTEFVNIKQSDKTSRKGQTEEIRQSNKQRKSS